MSVHQRKNNGSYYTVYRNDEGKQRSKDFGKGREGKRLAVAFDQEIKAHRKLKAPLPVATVEDEKLYLDQLIQAYLNARKLAGVRHKTLKEIASICEKHLIPAFAQKPAQEIKLDEIVSVVQAAYPKAATSTKNRYLGYLKAIFRFGLANEMITRNPLANWKKSKEAPRDLKLTLEDLQKIKEAAAPHLAWAITVAWNLGVRPGASELFAIKTTDIDWLDSSVRIYASKTKTWRVVPVSAEFLQQLRERQKVAQSGYIVEYQGKRISQFRNSFKTACKKAGITYDTVPYEIRHLFATSLLRANGDLSAVSRILGHQSIHMTASQYYHLLGDEKRRTIQKLPSLGGPGA